MVAAAIVGAGVVGAVGSGVAGSMSASATKDATNASIGEQQWALQQQEKQLAPYQAVGTAAIPKLEQLLGIGGGGSAGIQQTLSQLPGYQFQLQQGLEATKNAASASGMALSGNTLQALDKYSTGLADSTYQQQLQNIESAVGIGQSSAAGQSANIGQAGGNISNALINQGNTTASIDANTIAGISAAGTNAANQYITQNTLADIYGGGANAPVYNSQYSPGGSGGYVVSDFYSAPYRLPRKGT